MRRILLIITMVMSLTIPALGLPADVSACPASNTSQGQVLQGIGDSSTSCNSSGVGKAISGIVNLLSIFVGVLAIIMIIVAGYKYITSGGDANKVTNAKSTLLYALVGLAVAALAEVLVRFVLFRANGVG